MLKPCGAPDGHFIMHCLWDANLPLIVGQMYKVHLSIANMTSSLHAYEYH